MLDKEGLTSEISVGVTFSSLMGAVSLFFTGVLISQYSSFDASIKVPLLFLIISTFSFIFSATIYSNASTEITLNKLKVVEKYMIYAKNIVEFLGLYPLILSMPLVIGAVTEDNFLRTSTTIVALLGLALYSQSKFSVLEKQLQARHKRLYSAVFIGLAMYLYLSQSFAEPNSVLSYSDTGILLLTILLAPAVFFSLRSRQYKMTFVRPFRDSDAAHLSRIMKQNLNKLKSKYPDMAEGSIESRSAEPAIRKMATKEKVLVALFGGKVAGLVNLSGNVISAVFTDVNLHRKGIGRMLVDSAETEVGNHGFDSIEVRAGSTDIKFYQKLGYELQDKSSGSQSVLRKEL